MNEQRINVGIEVARVRGELLAFRDICLPAFDAPGGVLASRADGPDGETRIGLQQWREVIDRLLEALPSGGRAGRFDPEDFAFLGKGPEPSYSIEQGRIIWRNAVGMMSTPELISQYVPELLDSEWYSPADPIGSLLGRLPEVENRFLGLDMKGLVLANALSTILPHLVDADPEFVRRALDPETWRGIVRDRPGLTLEERAKKLDWIDWFWFGHVTNNGLLHVMGAAANNQFGLILDLLGHRNLNGRYTDLMPDYIFGVLLAKVRALRELSDGPDRTKSQIAGDRNHEPPG
jgi:hypothetical protein